MGATTRLTMAQAVVRFLAVQRTEPRRRRAAVLRRRLRNLRSRQRGRHRRRRSTQHREALRYYLARNEQAMVHTAAGLREDEQPAADPRLHDVDRSGRDQHDHRRRRRRPSTGCRCCCCPGDIFADAPSGASPAAARVEPVAGRLGQRLLQACVTLLGPDQPARTDPHRAARSDARVDVSLRKPARSRSAFRRTFRPKRSTIRPRSSRPRVWTIARPRPDLALLQRAASGIRAGRSDR